MAGEVETLIPDSELRTIVRRTNAPSERDHFYNTRFELISRLLERMGLEPEKTAHIISAEARLLRLDRLDKESRQPPLTLYPKFTVENAEGPLKGPTESAHEIFKGARMSQVHRNILIDFSQLPEKMRQAGQPDLAKRALALWAKLEGKVKRASVQHEKLENRQYVLGAILAQYAQSALTLNLDLQNRLMGRERRRELDRHVSELGPKIDRYIQLRRSARKGVRD